jgi:outer membrane protein assembly factor BamB
LQTHFHNGKEFHMKTFIACATLTAIAAAAAGAETKLVWPQFRGPNGSGVADAQHPPVEVGPDKNVKWKVPVPSGLSSPIVVGNKLVITAFDGGKLFTIAYDRGNGRELWRAEAPARELEPYNKTEGSPATSTPATDGEHIVSYFGSCGLFCYDTSGKQLWKFEMPPARVAGDFGSGVSPIIADGTAVLVRDQVKDAKIVAIDVATGSPRWEKQRQSPASYSTPVVWDTPAGKQIVAAGHARMIGYDLKSGTEKWFFAGIPSGCASSPVVVNKVLYFAGGSPTGPDDKEFQMPSFDDFLKQMDTDKDGIISKKEAETTQLKDFFDNQDANKDGRITRDEWDAIIKFFSEGKNVAFALAPGGAGDVSTSHVLWKQTKGLPYIASAIEYRGQYVMLKDGGVVTALDTKTGNQVYQKRAVASGNYYASPVAANGHIYFVSLSDGTVTVLKAGTSTPEEVAKNPPLGERVAATPAIADDTLYVRTAEHLYAFAAKK